MSFLEVNGHSRLNSREWATVVSGHDSNFLIRDDKMHPVEEAKLDNSVAEEDNSMKYIDFSAIIRCRSGHQKSNQNTYSCPKKVTVISRMTIKATKE